MARAGVSGNGVGFGLAARRARRAGEPARSGSPPSATPASCSGSIVVARPAGAVTFSEEDDRVLTELARQVGLALHNAQLDTALQTTLDELRRQADELRASRARIVASGDAERRRVERNLHDGAQQHLVALAVNLRLAKDIVARGPARRPSRCSTSWASAVQDTIQELRELAHGIYPPLLVDSGLVEALRAVANRSPLDVELSTDGIGRYDGDVEAAVYFCCLEALQNAGKHAPDAHVDGPRLGGVGRPAVRGHRRRPGLRRARGPARARLRQHGGPPGCHRWRGALGVRDRAAGPRSAARCRSSDQRLRSAKPSGVALVPEPAKGVGPSCSLFT